MLTVPPPTLSYALDDDFLLNRSQSPLPAKGEMGGVDPAGDAGGVEFPVEGLPAGRLIMMLRVTLTSTSSPPPSDRPIPPPSAVGPSLLGLERKPKEECFRRRPRPVSGRGPATVSSQSWSRRPIPLHGDAPEKKQLRVARTEL